MIGVAYNMRANLFLRRRKAMICTAKTTSEVANAVRKATRLMPVNVWAVPAPSAMVEDGSAAVVVDILESCYTAEGIIVGGIMT